MKLVESFLAAIVISGMIAFAVMLAVALVYFFGVVVALIAAAVILALTYYFYKNGDPLDW